MVVIHEKVPKRSFMPRLLIFKLMTCIHNVNIPTCKNVATLNMNKSQHMLT